MQRYSALIDLNTLPSIASERLSSLLNLQDTIIGVTPYDLTPLENLKQTIARKNSNFALLETLLLANAG